ncbi:mitochondrial pyruvate carrier 2-like [Leptinotarsa decemlineata]|uniref:mitochondrial pyruvate carrier 2-like n=1 Tax=Leptinotarsa decemlineata TaxID=7539 RepID=UPI003D308BD3
MSKVLNSVNFIRYPKRILTENQKKYLTHRYDHLVPKKLLPLWHHPAGPQTIFFWAPFVKWGLVIAGLSDLQRHPSTISARQCTSLAVAGYIWSRYALVITPKSYFLFSANFFVAVTQTCQLIRVFFYNRSLAQK